MATTISASVLSQAQSLNTAGQVAAAWQVLASAGDIYASAAYQVVANPDSFFGLIARNTWAAAGANLSLFNTVAQAYQASYLAGITPQNGFTLPSTTDIESDYLTALRNNGQPAYAAIDTDIELGAPAYFPNWYRLLGIESARVGSPSPLLQDLDPAEAQAVFQASNAATTITEFSLFVQGGTSNLVQQQSLLFGINDVYLYTTGGIIQFYDASTGNSASFDANLNGTAIINGQTIQINPTNWRLNNGQYQYLAPDGTWQAAQAGGPALIVAESDSAVTGLPSGSTVIADGSDTQITADNGSDTGANSDVFLGGTDDTANVGANVSLTDDGVGNSVSAGAGAILNIAGSSGTYVLAANATVTDTSANNTISTGQNSTVDVDADNVTLTNTGSGCTDGIHCAGDIVNSTGNTVNIGDNDSVTVNGSSDTITTGAGDNLDVTGDQNAISADDGSAINISGTDNIVGVDSNSVVNVYGSNITLNADSSSNTTAWGDANAAYISGSGGTVGFGGNTENAFISNGNVNLNQNNNSVTVYGNNDTGGSVWSGDTFGFEGTNENANFSNGTVNIDQPNESVTVSGDNDTANSSFTGDTLGFGGNTENAYISNGNVNLNNDNNSVTVYGNNDTEGSVWSGDTFGFEGTNENAYFSNGSVNIDQANENVTTWGDDDTANCNFSGDTLGFGGNNDNAYLSYGTVNIDEENNSVTVWGSNDNIGSSLSDDEVAVNGGSNNLTAGTDDDINLSGGGNTIAATTADHVYLSNTGTDGDTVNVSGDTANATDAIGNAGGIYLGQNVDVTVNGNDNSLPFGGASGCTVNINGGGNDITATADDHVYLSDTGAEVDTVDVSNDSASATDANGDPGGIYLGSNVDVTVNGDNNSLPFGGATGCLVDVYGNSNTIASGADNSITINSAFSTPDTLDVSDDQTGGTTVAGPSTSGIVIDANAAANIDGSGADTVYLGANSYLGLLNGSGYTVDASGGAILAAQDSTSFVLYGNDTQIYTGENDSFVVSGDNNAITGQAGDVIDVENNSVSDIDSIDVTGDQAGIFLGVDAAANVTGNSDIVNLQNGAYAGLFGSTGDAVFGANGTIATTSDTDFDLTGGDGSNDLVQLGLNSDITLEGGSGYTVDGQDSTIDATANTSFNLNAGNNSDDTVYLASNSYAGLLGGSGYTVDASGSSDTIDTWANTSFSFSGSDDTLNPSTGSTVYFTSGAYDDFNGTSLTVYASGSTNFNLDGGSNSNDAVVFSGSGGYLGLLGGSGYSVDATGASDTVDTWANTSFSFSGNYCILNPSTGSTVYFTSGANDDFNGSYLNVYASAATGFNLNGGSDSNDNVFFSGSGGYLGLLGGSEYTINASNDRLSTSSNTGFNLDGSGDTISLGKENYFGIVSGTDETVYASGDNIVSLPGNSLTVIGNNDKVTASGDDVIVDGNSDITLGDDDAIYATGRDDSSVGSDNYDSGSEFNNAGYSGGGGAYGYYGLATTSAASTAAGIDVVAQYDRAHGYDAAATAADNARNAAIGLLDSTSTTPVTSAPETSANAAISARSALSATSAGSQSQESPSAFWTDPTITWSFATGPNSGASLFSNAVGAEEQPAIEAALQTWATASGLTFEQVAAGSGADISIGFGDFDTASSNVVGYTTVERDGTWLLPGASVLLEDPSETALVNVDGQLTYTDTDVTLYQTALHEIGHALGLPDDSDPNSIMYPTLGANNITLDSADIAAIQNLYGPGGTASAFFPDTTMLAAQAAIASAAIPSTALAASAMH